MYETVKVPVLNTSLENFEEYGITVDIKEYYANFKVYCLNFM